MGTCIRDFVLISNIVRLHNHLLYCNSVTLFAELVVQACAREKKKQKTINHFTKIKSLSRLVIKTLTSFSQRSVMRV